MKILFWGTPQYAVTTLEALHDAGHSLVGVVTQPDRRRGRGQQLVPSPVKTKALEIGCPVFTPQRIRRDTALQAQLASLQADLSVVVAFGQILPVSVLQQPPLGCWNGHGSLLPRWRGAGPIQWSLLEGDATTGVGVMAMEEGLDTGPVLLERSIPIGLLTNAEQLALALSQLTATLMVEAMPVIEAAGAGAEQDRLERLQVKAQSGPTSYARLLNKDDYLIDWSSSALEIHRKVMGLYPNALARWHGKRFKIVETEPLIVRLREHLSDAAQSLLNRWDAGSTPPGRVLAVIDTVGVVVSSSGCPVLIRAGQLEGKKRSSGDALIQQMGVREGLMVENGTLTNP